MSKPAKSQYNETEAAEELGISVEHLRVLIRRHIVTTDDDANNIPLASFQPSDLLLLKLLTAGIAAPPAPPSNEAATSCAVPTL